MTKNKPATAGTYDNRGLEVFTVKSITGTQVLTTESTGFNVPADVAKLMVIGGSYVLETTRTLEVAGVASVDFNGKLHYLFRHDDLTLWNRWDKQVKDAKAKMIAYVDEHKEDWLNRAEALPDVLKRQLNEDDMYEYIGYGYILVICELAVMYKKSGGEDTEEILEYARREGTSGNQHQMAIAAARDLEF